MKVKELIEQLQKMPQEARVFHLWDGEPRTAINVVYQTKNGQVMTSDYDMECYSNNARPKDAPTSIQNPYWSTEEDPNGYTEEDNFDF